MPAGEQFEVTLYGPAVVSGALVGPDRTGAYHGTFSATKVVTSPLCHQRAETSRTLISLSHTHTHIYCARTDRPSNATAGWQVHGRGQAPRPAPARLPVCGRGGGRGDGPRAVLLGGRHVFCAARVRGACDHARPLRQCDLHAGRPVRRAHQGRQSSGQGQEGALRHAGGAGADCGECDCCPVEKGRGGGGRRLDRYWAGSAEPIGADVAPTRALLLREQDNANGTYTVAFTVPIEGAYAVEIKHSNTCAHSRLFVLAWLIVRPAEPSASPSLDAPVPHDTQCACSGNLNPSLLPDPDHLRRIAGTPFAVEARTTLAFVMLSHCSHSLRRSFPPPSPPRPTSAGLYRAF